MAEALTSPCRAVQFIRLMRRQAKAMDASIPVRQLPKCERCFQRYDQSLSCKGKLYLFKVFFF
jgi:hypothetical protein